MPPHRGCFLFLQTESQTVRQNSKTKQQYRSEALPIVLLPPLVLTLRRGMIALLGQAAVRLSFYIALATTVDVGPASASGRF
jgi:hypothetical protein